MKANKEWNTNVIFIRQQNDPVGGRGHEKPKDWTSRTV